jgi:WD40 repeat protein
VLLLLSLAAGVIPLSIAADPARVDAYGDPLPERALARLGTLRWRANSPVVFAAFLHDGQALLTVSQDYVAQVWELASGKEVRSFDISGSSTAVSPVAASRMPVLPSANNGSVALSADGKTLACVGLDNTVRVWNPVTGKEVRRLGQMARGSSRLALTSDGKTLAMAGFGQRISLWDALTGRQLGQFGDGSATGATRFLTYRLDFSRDGKSLLQYGIDIGNGGNKTAIVIWDPKNAKELRRFTDLPGERSSILTVAVAPDHGHVALPEQDSIVLFDVVTGKERRRLEGAGEGQRNHLLFSQDGKSLIAMTGKNEALTVWDVASGKVVLKFGKPTPLPAGPVVLVRPSLAPTTLTLAPDGRTLAWAEGPAVLLGDLQTGKERPGPAGHTSALKEVTFAPDGATLLTRASDATIRRWDGTTGREVGRVNKSGSSFPYALVSPDEKHAVSASANGTIHLFDATTGKERLVIQPEGGPAGTTMAFSPDSRTLALVGRLAGSVRLFDTATGQEKNKLTQEGPTGTGSVPRVLARRLLFSPDSRLLAAAADSLTVWDTTDGRELREIRLSDRTMLRHAAFSPDDRTLAVEFFGGELDIWELSSGKRRAVFGTPAKLSPAELEALYLRASQSGIAYSMTLAFSPDGRLLVQAGEDRQVHLRDMRTGKEVGRFAGHRGHLVSVTFAPDGRRMATSSTDTTALIWDVGSIRDRLTTPAAALSRVRMSNLWADLAGADAVKAYDAIRALASDPASAVPFLRERLKPAAGPDKNQLTKLIADLDATAFAVRVKARKELSRLGELAAPALREALNNRPSAEVRRQVEGLLGSLAGQDYTGDQLQILRALEVLEMAGTPESVAVLKVMAAGAHGAPPTVQAKASLERLGRLGKP